MSLTTSTTVVGVFEDRDHAVRAVNELLAAGFRREHIGIALRHDGEDLNAIRARGVKVETESHAAEGAVAGALTGLGVGALAGLGVLSGVIPVVGPAIAAGTLGVILSNAAAGAGVAGLVGALIGAGIPQEEAIYYQDEFEAGRTVVSVDAGPRRPEAISILGANGAYDMSSRPAGMATR